MASSEGSERSKAVRLILAFQRARNSKYAVSPVASSCGRRRPARRARRRSGSCTLRVNDTAGLYSLGSAEVQSPDVVDERDVQILRCEASRLVWTAGAGPLGGALGGRSEDRDGRRRDPRNAAGLADGFGPNLGEPLAHFPRQSRELPVLERGGDPKAFQCLPPLDGPLLAPEIAFEAKRRPDTEEVELPLHFARRQVQGCHDSGERPIVW